MPRVRVLLFASLSTPQNRGGVELDLPAGATVQAVCDSVARAHPGLAERLAVVAVAVNQSIVPRTHPLGEGDEVALLPPVSGGAGSAALHLTREPVSVDRLLCGVTDSRAGAIVLFLGVVRDHARDRSVSAIDYEAYAAMAENALSEIERLTSSQPGVCRAALVHRLGSLSVGEISVAIAVSAGHRAEGFDACRFAIERIKKDVPIWKKEHGADGVSWIEGDAAHPA
ncbi:MAG: molybdenum cofactor biosynthesis protein MoaE [Planctomycetes bacterium]|nr:molybdenum cofactor biosynthesis protein MoaE [Planctomycetota bacterium]